MPEPPGRRAWKDRLPLAVVAVAVAIAASAPRTGAATQGARDGDHRAVWKLLDANRTYQASAFAVAPRLVVTVVHNLFDVVLKAGTDKMVLVQTGRKGHIKIARTRSISATHDLALLETATPMEHHLSIAKALPHGLADQFYIAGYPKGRFETLRVITPIIHGDVDYYHLPMDRMVRGGISGAPLLAPNGEVVALQRRADDNVAAAVRFEVLNKFLNGEIGVSCGSMALKACLNAAAARTKQLAETGDIAAQYQLGREHRYIPGEPEMRWLKRAAEGGHAGARTGLAIALYFGERGLQKDWKRSFNWMRLGAEEEDPVAQLNLSVAYDFGDGVPKDRNKGLEWLHRALRNGYVGAEYNLGVMYYEGDGLPMDKKLGRYWLRRAAERGDEEAQKMLEGESD